MKTAFYIFYMAVLLIAAVSFGADTPSVSWFFAASLMGLAAIGLFLSRSSQMPVLLVVGVALLGVFVVKDALAGKLMRGAVDYISLFAAAASFLTGWRAMQHPDRIKRIWSSMLVLFLIFSCWAFLDFMVAADTIFGQARPWHEDRLSAAFLSANTAATFFGIISILAAGALLKTIPAGKIDLIGFLEKMFRGALPALLTFLVASTCLILTASRAGIAFTGLSLLVLLIWEVVWGRFGDNRRHILNMGLGLGGGILTLCLVFWVVSGDVAGARYADMSDDANARLVMFSAYWEAFTQAPLFGYGFGSFAAVNAAAMTAENAHILATQGAAHNVVLQWLLQVGLIGSVVMWGIVGAILIGVWRGLKRRQRYQVYLRTILCVSLLVILHGMADFALEIPGVMWWWSYLLGLGLGIAQGQTGTFDRREKHAKRGR